MATVTPSSFTKQPYEEFVIEFRFDRRLDSDELITAKIVTAALGNVDATSDVLAGSGLDSSCQRVGVGVKAGVTGNDYKISCRVTTDKVLPDGSFSKYEGDVIMAVREI